MLLPLPQLIVTLVTINSVINWSTGQHPLAKTPWGLIQGKYLEVDESQRVAAFLGIPYTLPPVGPLRFDRTKSLPDYPFHPINHHFHHHHTSKPIKADSFKAACIQQPVVNQFHSGNVSLSENCLYLNIFRPINNLTTILSSNDDHLLPVLVYVHGSAFIFGGPAQVHNQVQYLAAYGNIMVVTMSHRLAFLGQAYDGPVDLDTLKQSTDHDYNLPGNQYLHDIIQSLEWVHDNIRHFGGDPERVTLGGLSAGAVIATSIFVSPAVSDGLFNKVFIMSGLPIYPSTVLSPLMAKRAAQDNLALVNCSSPMKTNETKDEPFDWDEVNCLKHANPFPMTASKADFFYYPMFGDSILPEIPQKLIKQFKRKNYSLLIGTEQMEDVVSIPYTPKTVDEAINWLINRYNQQIESTLSDNYTSIIKSYFNELSDDQLNNRTIIEATFHQIISDFVFICPSLLMGKIFSLTNQVHFYRNYLILDADKYKRPFGTNHADDAALFIGYPFINPSAYSDSDREISLQMMKLLGSFVRDAYIPWPAIRGQEDEKVIPYVWKITNPINYQNFEFDPFSKRCNQWATIYAIEDI